MKLTNSKLAGHLKTNLASRYLVINAEPVLLNEERDQIRIALNCAQRSLFLVDYGFDFAEAHNEVVGGNLFGDKVLVEFICAEDLTATVASKFIEIATAAKTNDVAVLIGCPGISKRGKWTQTLAEHFVTVTAAEVLQKNMAGWVAKRAQQHKLKLTDEAVQYIASMTEGNLSMAAQELAKLALVVKSDTEIDYAQVHNSTTDVSRDDLASLREALAAGDTLRSIRAVRNLQAEQVQLPLVIWALAEEGRALLQLIHKGKPWGIFGPHLYKLQDLAARVKASDVLAWLAGVAKADWSSKGLTSAAPWLLCERLVLAFTLLVRSNRINKSLL